MPLYVPLPCYAIFVTFAVICSGPASAQLPAARFPLGDATSSEGRKSIALTAGVILHDIEVRSPTPATQWLVSAGVARTRSEQRGAVRCLKASGLTARRLAYRTPGQRPTPYRELVGGRFATEEKAMRAISPSPGCTLRARAFAASPDIGNASWRLWLVEIQPKAFKGRLRAVLGRDQVAGVETTSSIARRTGAIVAINGGFFAMEPDEGVVGEPTGLFVQAGQIRSEPTIGRPYLVMSDGGSVRATVMEGATPSLSVRWNDGTVTALTGVDRHVGQVRDCGTVGAAANRLPAQDVTCHPENDLVVITPDSGFAVRNQDVAVVVGTDGRLRYGAIPGPAEMVLAASGRMASLLREKLARGATARIDLRYSSDDNLSAVNGAPWLVRNHQAVRQDDREGWGTHGVPRSRLEFVHRWSVLRNPRTAAGTGDDGTIWFAVVDGREYAEEHSRAATSVGMSIEELRRVMLHLGVKDAMNLDGGGSTTLVVNARVVNRPSDPEGERVVGSAIVIAADR